LKEILWTRYNKLWYLVRESPYMTAYTAYDTVHGLATEQHGVFKAAQATELGINPKTLVAMAARGRLQRIAYGLYQDKRVPEDRWTPFMAAVLWPYGEVGLLARETVLSLLELSDVNPGLIHVAVPGTYRLRHRQPPAGVVLHHETVPEDERTAIEGIPATTVARAIRDCAHANLGPALIRQALDDARTTGWLTTRDAETLSAELTDAGKL
jgi:predicted transcriptional regulator of viral defense system